VWSSCNRGRPNSATHEKGWVGQQNAAKRTNPPQGSGNAIAVRFLAMRTAEKWAVAGSVAAIIALAWGFVPQIRPNVVTIDPNSGPVRVLPDAPIQPRGAESPPAFVAPSPAEVESARGTLRRLFQGSALNFSEATYSTPETGRRRLDVLAQAAIVSQENCRLDYRSRIQMTDDGGQTGVGEFEVRLALGDIDPDSFRVTEWAGPPRLNLKTLTMFTRDAKASIEINVLRREPPFDRLESQTSDTTALFVADGAQAERVVRALRTNAAACSSP
jgi:hypothetical protein